MRTGNARIRISKTVLFRISKYLYGSGVLMIVTALVLSTGVIPAAAAPGGPGETYFCDLSSYGGETAKVENQSSPWTFTVPAEGYISVVGIKAATECATIFTEDGSNTCYGVSGIGTSSITVWDLEDAPPACREISHLEIVIVDPVPTTTPTATATSIPPTETATPLPPTNTPIPPTETSTPPPPTETSTPLPPTNTPIPPTATSTPPPPTETTTPPPPTNTPIPPTETSTPPPPTETATPLPPTNTPIPPTATSTPLPPTTTATSPPPTETQEEPTPTRVPPTETPVPTLPPPPQGDPELLIPVTGFEVPFSAADEVTRRAVFVRTSANFSLLFFGLGFIFHGAALWKGRQDGDEA